MPTLYDFGNICINPDLLLIQFFKQGNISGSQIVNKYLIVECQLFYALISEDCVRIVGKACMVHDG